MKKLNHTMVRLLLTALLLLPFSLTGLAASASAASAVSCSPEGIVGGSIRFDASKGTVVGCDASVTKASIPEKINGVAVKAIGAKAFSKCGALTEVTLPDSVTTIGDWAFRECTALTEMKLPDSVTELGKGAFYGCSALAKLELGNGVKTIGSRAFYECGALTEVDIPASVTKVGEYAFFNCGSVIRVTVGSEAAKIGKYAFFNSEVLSDAKKLNELEAAIRQALEGVRPEMSDREKAQTVHDRLTLTVEYDTAGKVSRESCESYGALVKGRAVCEGYADAFRILMKRCGVSCVTVRNASHAWNLVRVDGEWLHVDATWDDLGGNTVCRDYFLLDDAAILATDTAHGGWTGAAA